MGKLSKKLENRLETQAGSKRKAHSLPSHSHSQPLDCDKAQVIYGIVLIALKQGGKESTGGGVGVTFNPQRETGVKIIYWSPRSFL